MRIVSGTWVVRILLLTVAAAFLAAAPSVSAAPSTPEIEATRAKAEAARAEMEELAAVAEVRHEEYMQLEEALSQTRREIAETREALEIASQDLLSAEEALAERASGIYRNGNVEMIEVLLGTTSFEDFLTRIEWLRRINRNDAILVMSVREAKQQVEEKERALERREQEQSILRHEAKVKKAEVERALLRQERYVESIDAEVARLVAEEEERLRREAEERARRAAEEAARRAAEAAARSAAADTSSSSRLAAPGPRSFDSNPDRLGQGRPEAVTVGMRYIGVPYVWGGSTPDGFDCSGLVQYVYREIGISLPRTSRMQFTVGSYIPPDRMDLLLPGDLVFFGYGGDSSQVHHVGIYVGGSDYLHAPRRGEPVQVNSLTDRIARRGDYVGATRP